MQNITLIVVGKFSERFFKEGCAEYQKRLQAYCNFKVVELAEEPSRESRPGSAEIERALQKEGERILQSLPKGCQMCALCVEGTLISSEELADYFAKTALGGTSSLAFVIGSSHGLCETVKKQAARRISMSRMTFPHQLARLVLTEQIYRACTINAGVRYHK